MTEDTKTETAAPVLKFKVKAFLTVPLLKVEEGKDYAVTIETPLKKADATPPRKVFEEFTNPDTGVIEKREKVVAVKEPPTTCQVTNLYTGQRNQMIVGAIMLSELSKKYTGDEYVGKSFAFKVFSIAGKQYKGIELAEVEVEATVSEAAPAADAAAPATGKGKK